MVLWPFVTFHFFVPLKCETRDSILHKAGSQNTSTSQQNNHLASYPSLG